MHFPTPLIIPLLTLTSLTTAQTPPIPIPNLKIHEPTIPFLPSPSHPPPNPACKTNQITTLFHRLTPSTKWSLVEKIPLSGSVGEPEGLVRLTSSSSPNPTSSSSEEDTRYVLSLGHFPLRPLPYFPPGTTKNGTDRTVGAGSAHLVLFHGNGTRIADLQLSGEIGEDDEYHPGGIDYDGKHVWMTIAQYRPNSTAKVVRVDPATMRAEMVFRADDHYGAIVRDVRKDRVLGLNWAGRGAGVWQLGDGDGDEGLEGGSKVAEPVRKIRNPSFWVDYQDCKFLGYPEMYGGERGVMICGGVKGGRGGLALVDLESLVPLAEVPVDVRSGFGSVITQNPVDVDVVGGRLRGYFVPDLEIGTVWVYEAEIEEGEEE
ncbi:hypothetical protein AJ79_05390 [Helicocarpus griseus UAMH5409]|uniref:SMP-30/Gluconolactonase/LRE-like region domain-containing protein n=1 Tax=Helicocarpus griseus UAMH5409 TaxID=1447875 RepID=A0A2B7XPM0_9EURO|nr:hypothetical protein AJ79_05390 [Helicocarpus griseus UAMH5409]